MTKYFFFIWSRKLWQNVLLLLMVSMVVKLKNLSFSFISCDKIYEIKFITFYHIQNVTYYSATTAAAFPSV